jgi:hypothetical protein
VVVDLPRTAAADVAEGVLAEADLAVLVVPARVRAAAAARSLVGAGPGMPAPAWGAARLVVRTVPGCLSPAEVGSVVGRPVLGVLGHDRSAVARGERGEPPLVAARSPLGAAARKVLAALPARSGAVA